MATDRSCGFNDGGNARVVATTLSSSNVGLRYSEFLRERLLGKFSPAPHNGELRRERKLGKQFGVL
jgi:hypothetical protein